MLRKSRKAYSSEIFQVNAFELAIKTYELGSVLDPNEIL